MLGLPFSCSGRAVPVVVRVFDDPSELKNGAETRSTSESIFSGVSLKI
jgi:hypothetical protein